MAKVTGTVGELVSHVRVMFRAAVLNVLEDYGFPRPDKIDFTYSIEKQAVLMRMRYGRYYVDHFFDDHTRPPHGGELEGIIDSLALDARIPIAEEL